MQPLSNRSKKSLVIIAADPLSYFLKERPVRYLKCPVDSQWTQWFRLRISLMKIWRILAKKPKIACSLRLGSTFKTKIFRSLVTPSSSLTPVSILTRPCLFQANLCFLRAGSNRGQVNTLGISQSSGRPKHRRIGSSTWVTSLTCWGKVLISSIVHHHLCYLCKGTIPYLRTRWGLERLCYLCKETTPYLRTRWWSKRKLIRMKNTTRADWTILASPPKIITSLCPVF